MTVTPEDLALFAARIRTHFEPELRDVAEELALQVARVVGADVSRSRHRSRAPASRGLRSGTVS